MLYLALSSCYSWKINTSASGSLLIIQASKYEDLLPVMETRFDSAIVLGTQATAEQLEPQSQDTRVLSMLLCIKHVTVDSEDRPDVWKNSNIPPLHIVSENEIDQTAEVAVVPSGSGKDPDFINTQ